MELKNIIKDIYNFLRIYPINAGDMIYRFEEKFKELFNVKYCLTCSSGSAAIYIALKALGVEIGDNVMTNCINSNSVINSIKTYGANTVLIDIGKSNVLTISLDDLEYKIKKTNSKTLLLVHMDGYPIENTIEVIRLCKKYNVKVIEDCCQAIGAKIDDKYVGNFGDIGLYSIDSNKIIKSGEGGVLVTNNKHFYDFMASFKNQGKSMKIDGGFNFRYNDFSAIYGYYSLLDIYNNLNKRFFLLKKLELFILKNKLNINLIKPSKTTPNYYNIIIKLGKVYNKDILVDYDFISNIKFMGFKLNVKLFHFINLNKLYKEYLVVNLSYIDRYYGNSKEKVNEIYNFLKKVG